MTREQRKRLIRLSSNTVSDAMDALGFVGATHGIRPLWENCSKIVGEAVTIKLGPTGLIKNKNTHLCVDAINAAKPGDIILIDNNGNTEISCWGGLLANGAQVKGIGGVAIDGVARDLDYFIECGFPVYARGVVVRTSRGRIMEYETNGTIQFCNIQVRPGDVVIGDRSGISIIPKEKLEEVLVKAEDLDKREANMMKDVEIDGDMFSVDAKYDYANWLKNE